MVCFVLLIIFLATLANEFGSCQETLGSPHLVLQRYPVDQAQWHIATDDALAYATDEKNLSDQTQGVSIWDTNTGSLVETFHGSARSAASTDGSKVAVLPHITDHIIQIWDVISHAVIASIPVGSLSAETLASDRTGSLLAVSAENRISLWNISHPQDPPRVVQLISRTRNPISRTGYNIVRIASLRFTEDGSHIVAFSDANEIYYIPLTQTDLRESSITGSASTRALFAVSGCGAPTVPGTDPSEVSRTEVC